MPASFRIRGLFDLAEETKDNFNLFAPLRHPGLDMESEKSARPLFEWLPPPAYLKWRLSRAASITMLIEFALGFLGGIFIYAALGSIMLAVFFLIFAVIMGLTAKRLIPRTNAGTFRALSKGLETRAASKRQYVAYRHLSSCTVEQMSHEGIAFALLRFQLSAEYERTRKWYEPRMLKRVPIDEGEELKRVSQILKEKGVSVIYAEGPESNL